MTTHTINRRRRHDPRHPTRRGPRQRRRPTPVRGRLCPLEAL